MASAHFDKLILLNKRLIAFGTPAEVFRPEVLREAFGGQIAIWNVDSAEGHHTMLVTDHCCP
jgi:ABC-type Mn2+/Zn2+ transport system ATPase subunit